MDLVYDERLQQLLEHDKKYTKEQLLKYIFNNKENQGEYTDAQWYKRYISAWKDKQFALYHGFNKPEDEDLTNITGFRSKTKNKALRHKLKISDTTILNHNDKLLKDTFPLKENKKKYLTHLIYPEGTYFIDIMFSHDSYFLLAINFTTRYLYINELKDKSAEEVIQSFHEMMKGVEDIRVVRGDKESAFISEKFKAYLEKYHQAVFIPSERIQESYGITTIVHDKLGVIDRATRTLRDMAYVAGFTDPIPFRILNHLVNNYNIAPHAFLSKYAHTSVSPEDVSKDHKLLLKIWRNVEQHNFKVKNREGYQLRKGEVVSVYNDDKTHKRRTQVKPEQFRVIGYKNGNYILQNQKGDIQNYSRFRIKPNF